VGKAVRFIAKQSQSERERGGGRERGPQKLPYRWDKIGGTRKL